MRIALIAPASPVGRIELGMGIERLRGEGWDVRTHRQVTRKHLFFAGTDEQRLQGVLDSAWADDIDVLWCARGGWGSFRLLSALAQETRRRGKPRPKLLIGYSDATALLEFARVQWGWPVIHGPMAGTGEFSQISTRPWSRIRELVHSAVEGTAPPEISHRVRWMTAPPASAIRAPLVGGNLAVWASLVGTPFQGRAEGSILFLEDVGEALYRLDRMVQQLDAAGGFRKARAIVLGTFDDCRDSVMSVLAARPVPGSKRAGKASANLPRKPLRPKLSQARALREIFAPVAERHGIPVGYGLPVGHGGGHYALPFGVRYELSPGGVFQLLS